MVTRKQAWEKVNELIKNRNLVNHCLAVESAMLAYAGHFHVAPEEKTQWGIAGLVHDADWEKYPDEHPQVVIKWLTEQGATDDMVNAVAAHGFNFNIEAKTLMAKTLRSVDELTGLIVAVALIKDRKLANVTIDSIKNKWKKKDFAKGVKREDIIRGAEEINIPLDQHLETVLKATQSISNELGL